MSQQWIKIRTSLTDDPDVLEIADMCEIDPDLVVGKLIRLWSWADSRIAENGDGRGVTKAFVDRCVGVTGFANALLLIGWFSELEGHLVFSNWERHNGKSAKSRALTMSRTQKYRDGLSVTREEERREEERRREKKTSEKKRSAPTGASKTDLSAADTKFKKIKDEWNQVAPFNGLPLLRKVPGPPIRKKFEVRERDYHDFWKSVLAELVVPLDPFALGSNDRNWRLDFNYVCSGKVEKLLQGGWQAKEDGQPLTPKRGSPMDTMAQFNAAQDEIDRRNAQ